MPKSQIRVVRESPRDGIEVVIEVEVYPGEDCKKEARRVLRMATEEALLLLGEATTLT